MAKSDIQLDRLIREAERACGAMRGVAADLIDMASLLPAREARRRRELERTADRLVAAANSLHAEATAMDANTTRLMARVGRGALVAASAAALALVTGAGEGTGQEAVARLLAGADRAAECLDAVEIAADPEDAATALLLFDSHIRQSFESLATAVQLSFDGDERLQRLLDPEDFDASNREGRLALLQDALLRWSVNEGGSGIEPSPIHGPSDLREAGRQATAAQRHYDAAMALTDRLPQSDLAGR